MSPSALWLCVTKGLKAKQVQSNGTVCQIAVVLIYDWINKAPNTVFFGGQFKTSNVNVMDTKNNTLSSDEPVCWRWKLHLV